jgi:hypothetical protein
MQGVFNIDWDDVMEPNLDEKTSHQYNKKRKGDDDENFTVFPPDLEFTIFYEKETLRIFVVNGSTQLREGAYGHYIKPYAVYHRGDKIYTKPYPNKPQQQKHLKIFPGTPGYPYPPTTICQQFEGASKVQIQNLLTNLTYCTIRFQAYTDVLKRERKYSVTGNFDDLFLVTRKDVFEEYQTPSITDNGLEDQDPHYLPDTKYAQENVDYIRALHNNTPFYEIGREHLTESLKQAEELDYEFSKKIQGLTGSSSEYIWSCLDPDFEPMDRNKLLSVYLENYSKEFSRSSKSDPDFRAVARHEIQQHKAFCEEWVRKHYKTLTPNVTATAELVVAEIYPYIKHRMKKDFVLTIPQLSRVLMRHPTFSTQFAICLQNYMQNIENTRAGRNPSYKQITTVQISKALAFKTFVNYFESNKNVINEVFEKTSSLNGYFFDVYVIDWHYIIGKLPDVHKHYKRLKLNTERDDTDKPPWMIAKPDN